MNFLQTLLFMLCQMAPYLLLGFFVAGLLHVFVPSKFFERHLSQENFKSVLWATLLGIPLPLCSCGVIPTAISLRRDGASRGATVAFMIATPQTGIDSIIATYSLMGLPFAIIRPVVALLTALSGGMVTTWFSKDEIVVHNNSSCSVKTPLNNKLIELLRYSFVDLIQNMGKWLTLGLIIGALITVLVPDSFFTSLNLPPLITMLIVLLVAIPMYVCAMGSIPIAAALMMKGLSPGTALVFLIAGPATSIASMLVIGKSLGKKQLLFYLISIIIGSITCGLFIDYLLPRSWFDNSMLSDAISCNHSVTPSWIEIISASVFVLLLINAFIMKLFNRQTVKNDGSIIYRINGMTCNHCKASVEKAIGALDNIEDVVVDLGSKTASVKGNPDDEAVKKAVEEIGFEYVGRK